MYIFTQQKINTLFMLHKKTKKIGKNDPPSVLFEQKYLKKKGRGDVLKNTIKRRNVGGGGGYRKNF